MGALPKITFNISKNGLGQAQADIQKVPAIIITGVAVTGTNKVNLNQSYQLFSLKDAEDKGITQSANPLAWHQIKCFYEKAGTGAELWVMLVANTVTYTQMADLTNTYATKLLNDAAGKVRVIGFVKMPATTDTISNGLDADVTTAVVKAQALCDDYALRYFPLRSIISANKFNGTVSALKDYKTTDFNKVALLLSNNGEGNLEVASIGECLGRLASVPVQRKINRVKDGAISDLKAYFTNGESVNTLSNAWEAIHAKGYIFHKYFANRSGYYYSSDQTLTSDTDDFNSLARGLVMDKAVVICYNTLIDELSDEIAMTEDGKIEPSVIKYWQANVENQLNLLMVDKKELSAAKCFIDSTQNILSTNNLNVGITLLPVGYSDYITINIGFTTKIA